MCLARVSATASDAALETNCRKCATATAAATATSAASFAVMHLGNRSNNRDSHKSSSVKVSGDRNTHTQATHATHLRRVPHPSLSPQAISFYIFYFIFFLLFCLQALIKNLFKLNIFFFWRVIYTQCVCVCYCECVCVSELTKCKHAY